ncbi:MAG: hypothetical protein Q9214_007155, partial [Letrouitia sp. 1 TL-2023]
AVDLEPELLPGRHERQRVAAHDGRIAVLVDGLVEVELEAGERDADGRRGDEAALDDDGEVDGRVGVGDLPVGGVGGCGEGDGGGAARRGTGVEGVNMDIRCIDDRNGGVVAYVRARAEIRQGVREEGEEVKPCYQVLEDHIESMPPKTRNYKRRRWGETRKKSRNVGAGILQANDPFERDCSRREGEKRTIDRISNQKKTDSEAKRALKRQRTKRRRFEFGAIVDDVK